MSQRLRQSKRYETKLVYWKDKTDKPSARFTKKKKKTQRIKDVTILGYNLVAKLIKIRIQSASI